MLRKFKVSSIFQLIILMGVPILAEYFKNKNFDDIVVVSPDHGGVTRARKMAERLKSTDCNH